MNEFNTAPVYWCVAHVDDICKNDYVFSWCISPPLETRRDNYGALRTAEEAGIGTPLFIHATLQDKYWNETQHKRRTDELKIMMDVMFITHDI